MLHRTERVDCEIEKYLLKPLCIGRKFNVLDRIVDRDFQTALACKRDYPVYVDETSELFDIISISAGVRGTQILLSPSDYLAAVKGTAGSIARDKSS